MISLTALTRFLQEYSQYTAMAIFQVPTNPTNPNGDGTPGNMIKRSGSHVAARTAPHKGERVGRATTLEKGVHRR